MKDVIERHDLSNGRAVWIQRVKIPGVRRASWIVVTCNPYPLAPEIIDAQSKDQALRILADILQADVMESLGE
jgi:hypothetical protein